MKHEESMIKWELLSIEKMSILGLFLGKFVIGLDAKNSCAMIAFGKDRKCDGKVLLIDCNNEIQYANMYDSIGEAQKIAEQIVIHLTQSSIQETVEKMKLTKIN